MEIWSLAVLNALLNALQRDAAVVYGGGMPWPLGIARLPRRGLFLCSLHSHLLLIVLPDHLRKFISK